MKQIEQTPKEALEQALIQNDFSLEKSQIKKLLEYIQLVFEWNSHINLTAHNTLQLIVFKDIIDCMYLNMYIKKYLKNVNSVADLGCGAGFIGVILSILKTSPQVTFVESNRKKLNFVKQACRSLDLTNNTYINTRAELISIQYQSTFNITISRATWKSKEWLNIATRYTTLGGHLIRMAGMEKNDSPEMKAFQGLEREENFFYIIKPENFKRHLEIFKKA